MVVVVIVAVLVIAIEVVAVLVSFGPAPQKGYRISATIRTADRI